MSTARKLTALLTGIAALGISGLTATTALAEDNGDRNPACNRGEICFSYDGTRNYQKHFWYAASHDNLFFVNVNTGKTTSLRVRDNAYSIWNRDTACDVKVVDDRGIFADDVHKVAKNSSGWVTLISSVRNQNDRHERC